jgi:hypothetical protein
MRAFLSQPQRCGAADALTAASQEYDLALYAPRHGFSFLRCFGLRCFCLRRYCRRWICRR